MQQLLFYKVPCSVFQKGLHLPTYITTFTLFLVPATGIFHKHEFCLYYCVIPRWFEGHINIIIPDCLTNWLCMSTKIVFLKNC